LRQAFAAASYDLIPQPVEVVHISTDGKDLPEAMPSFVDLIALRLSEPGESAAGRKDSSFKDDNGYIVVPCETLLRSEQTLVLKTL
jgi:hypothetical protein